MSGRFYKVVEGWQSEHELKEMEKNGKSLLREKDLTPRRAKAVVPARKEREPKTPETVTTLENRRGDTSIPKDVAKGTKQQIRERRTHRQRVREKELKNQSYRTERR